LLLSFSREAGTDPAVAGVALVAPAGIAFVGGVALDVVVAAVVAGAAVAGLVSALSDA
jgi:hypothetical protein